MRRVLRTMHGASLLTSVLSPAQANIESSDVFALDTTACDEQPTAVAFVQALQVELAAQQASAEEELPSPPQAARIVDCHVGEGRVVLAVGDTHTAIDVSDVPVVAQARTAAVAVSETLRWLRLTPAPIEVSAINDAEPPRPLAESKAEPALGQGGTDGLDQRTASDSPPHTNEFTVLSRGAIRGPEQSLLWGAEVRLVRRFAPRWLVGVSTGYLTTEYTSVLGDTRLHGVTLGLTFDRAWAGHARSTEWRLGVGLEGMHSTVDVKSNWGFDESTVRAFSANADVHGTFVGAIDDAWAFTTTAALIRSVLGVALQSGGREGISLYGWGFDARAGVAYRF